MEIDKSNEETGNNFDPEPATKTTLETSEDVQPQVVAPEKPKRRYYRPRGVDLVSLNSSDDEGSVSPVYSATRWEENKNYFNFFMLTYYINFRKLSKTTLETSED